VQPITTTRQRSLKRIAALETERSSWFSHWQEINRVLLPRSGQFFASDANKGSRRNQDILDNTATRAITTLAAGMQSGLTSPARPWLKLETADVDLMNVKAVSAWLDKVTGIMRTVFSRSNTYRALHGMYGEIGAYGTTAAVVLPDFQNVIHFWPLTVGGYAISANDRGQVDTLSRHYSMTVAQLVEKYVYANNRNGTPDWSKVSHHVKNAWDNHNHDSWVPVYHLIQPRVGRDTRKVDSRNMPFESICFEAGGNENLLLSESGYKRFPAIVNRWTVKGEDIYGSDCPGMVALGDIYQLQHEQLRKGQGIDYQTKPPLQVPVSLKNQDSDFLPGGVTYVDQVGPQNAVRTAFDVRLELQHLLADMQDVRQRINAAFYSDLFLFLSNISGLKGQMTAREVAEIHEEKLLMLGPVVENTEGEQLNPLIDITFDACLEAGILPPPPPELQQKGPGAAINVEFIGLLSQAQRAVSMGGVDRLVGAVASIAAAKQDPSVWDKINTDKIVDKAASYLGVDPEIINGDDEVAEIRNRRAQAQQAATQAEAAAQMAATAKDMAAADMSTDNALTNVVRGFSPA
jgi:hypothetical protein